MAETNSEANDTTTDGFHTHHSETFRPEDSEAIRQSLEALDEVLKEFETAQLKVTNGLSVCKPNLKHKESVRDPAQSLAFLDGVLAQYESSEDSQTKEEGYDSPSAQSNNSNIKPKTANVPGGKIASSRNSPQPSPASSPRVERSTSLVTSAPPVPKRSPTTCLSTSSAPSTPSEGLLDDPFDSDGPTCTQNDSTHSKVSEEVEEERSRPPEDNPPPAEKSEGVGREGKKSSRRLSSRPVQKGAPRPKVRAPPVQEEEEEEKENEGVLENLKEETETKSPAVDEIRPAKKAALSEVQDSKPVTNMDKVSAKFSHVKHLLLTGQLAGLDEPPPKFKPPPPPNNKNIKNATKHSKIDSKRNCPKKGLAVHVTSVKITPEVHSAAPSSVPNVSVITIQDKTERTNSTPDVVKSVAGPDASNVMPKVLTTSLPNLGRSNAAKTNKMSKTTSTFYSPSIPTNNNNTAAPLPSRNNQSNVAPSGSASQLANANNVEPRLKLSTFNREVTSSRSSSQEELNSSNNNNNSLERKPLDQPDVRNTTGPVYFNVFQCDTMSHEGVAPVAAEPENKKTDPEVGKKKGWMPRRSKKVKPQSKGKEESKEPIISETTETAPSLPDKSLVIAELSGRLRRAPSPPKDKLPAPPPAYLQTSAPPMEDSDEDVLGDAGSTQGTRGTKEDRGKWRIWK